MRLVSIVTSLFLLISLSTTVNAEGFYKWKDARGNTQYGDEPPTNVKAKRVKLPDITILEGYGDQWKSPDPAPVARVAAKRPPAVATPSPLQYSTLRFIAPKAGQLIKAKDGDVSAMLSLKPPLKRGHSILYLVDGKNARKGTSRIANFKNLSNGAHRVSVNIINKSGKVIQSSNTVAFNVAR